VIAAGLATKGNETLRHHVTVTSSMQAPPTVSPLTSLAPPTRLPATPHTATSRDDDVIIDAALHHSPHYDDVNMPSGSYFTGDEEIPVWNNVPDRIPLLAADDGLYMYDRFRAGDNHVTRATTSQAPPIDQSVTSVAPPTGLPDTPPAPPTGDKTRHHVIHTTSSQAPPTGYPVKSVASPTGPPITSVAPPTGPPLASAAPPGAVTSRADDVIDAALRHWSYDHDVNIPSNSYFTGDEDIPIWNVPSHHQLLDSDFSPSQAVATDGDKYNVVDDKLAALHQLLAHYLPHRTAPDCSDVTSPYNLVTSPVTTPTSSRRTVSPSTTTTTSTTTTLQTDFLTSTTTAPPQSPTSTTTQSTSPADVTTTRSTIVQHSASRRPAVSRSHASAPAAVKTAQPRRRQPASARHPSSPPRRVGGLGTSEGRRYGNHHFDFFDYIVDFQTPRPQTRRPRRKRIQHGGARSRSPDDAINPRPNELRRPDVYDYGVDGQLYGVETTGSGTAGQWFRQRGGSQRRRLPQSVPVWIARPAYRPESVQVTALSTRAWVHGWRRGVLVSAEFVA